VSEEVSTRQATEHVTLVEFSRPPHNYFDGALIGAIADAYEQLERDGSCRAIALSADFRVASPDSRFSANFARLGIHHGFGVTVTLPLAVGPQRALELLYTGVRLDGEEAHTIGLCDRLVASDRLREEAVTLAGEIAASSPLAVRAIRQTMRGHLADQIRGATAHEAAEQAKLFGTNDFREGVSAAAERRPPRFTGS
jgi:2-(1,2-epoxy-1,2-dihydrophenyl)acetyl-CoA isomerase